MMSMSEGLLLSKKPTVQDGIYPLPLQNPCHSLLPFCGALASDQPRFGLDSQHLSLDDQHYKVIPENTGICRFVWEHLNDINCVLQHVKKAGGTFSAWKMDVCVPEIGRA